MKLQSPSEGDIPKILPFLTDGILALNGQKSEGIFRYLTIIWHQIKDISQNKIILSVPGDSEMVSELRLRIEKQNYNLEGITDPMVPASLLKLWLRELSDPLIPMDL